MTHSKCFSRSTPDPFSFHLASDLMSEDWGQLFISHFDWPFCWLILLRKSYCSEVRSSLFKVQTNDGKYMNANPSSFLWPKVLTGVTIKKQRKCYSICIFSTWFQPPWKENRSCNPLPLEIYHFQTPLPLRIFVILRGGGGGGGGMDIFWNHTWSKNILFCLNKINRTWFISCSTNFFVHF